MSGEMARYRIEVSVANIPDELAGVPLPFEVVSPNGKTRRAMLIPSVGASTTEPIDSPGRYLVRVELPSGQWVVETATVPDLGAGEQQAAGAVELDFGADLDQGAAKPAVLESALTQTLALERSGRALPSRRDPLSPGLPLMKNPLKRNSFDAIASDPRDENAAVAAGVALAYGVFHAWRSGGGDVVVIEGKGESTVDLPGDLALGTHPGWSEDTAEWRPLLVRVTLPAAAEGGPMEALVVWPPSRGNQPLSLSPASSPGINADAPPLLARSASGDKVADALFAYARGGRLDLARQAAPMFVDQAQKYLGDKTLNPVHAILGTYALQKVGGAEHPDWLSNLASGFPYLVDGALLYGWYLIRTGRAPEAKAVFCTALARGVPLFSTGIRLLRDGLSFLRGLYPDDSDLKAAGARAFRLAAAANPDSELSCLRLGKGLTVELV